MFTRKFTLRHTFGKVSELDEFSSGPQQTHFGVSWSILVHKNPECKDEDEPCLGVYLKCRKEVDGKHPWSVSFEATIRIENGNEEDKIEETFEGKYDEESDYGVAHICNWETMMEKYVKNDKLTVEIDVIITKMKGLVPKRKLNFDQPEEHKTDVVLIVGDQKFNVLKGMLARFSDYFGALFFNGCKESQQAEIKLEEVDPDTFHMILEIIHGELDCIQNRTVERILDLARQYQIKVVTKRCVDFMINKTNVDLDKKFRLASVYNLVDLQDHLLKKINSKKDSDARLTKSSKYMSDAFIMKMIRKVYE